MAFQARLTKPGKGNKYYIRKANGGWSDAILGKPTDPDCNTLANCVGYAYGRFNEIGKYGECRYLAPVNAENFMDFKGDLPTGFEPKLGSCMVWQKGATLSSKDGAGHVAIVEQVIDNDTVLTSESSYGGEAFYLRTRHRGDGCWEQGADYKFLGFIYNPAVPDKTILKVGDEVVYIGTKHYVSQNAKTGYPCKGGKAIITKIKYGALHPYHLIRVKGSGATVYGWVDGRDILDSGEKYEPRVGDVVYYEGDICYNWQNASKGSKCVGGRATITKIYTNGAKHPYHLVRVKGSGATVWGFVDEGTFTPIQEGAGDYEYIQ